MHARLVHNPSAGQQNAGPQIDDAIDVLREHGWTVDLVETARPDDARALARAAATEKLDAVIAVGGDGTLNEVANGVVGSSTAVGVLPLGTANVWAKEMGLPLGNLPLAARLLAESDVRTVDVGQVSGPTILPRIFIIACGVGLDAAITQEVEPQRKLKRQYGAIFYWLVGVRQAWSYRGKPIVLTVGEERLRRRVLLALAANTQLYGGIVRIAPYAKVDDGLLNLVVFKGTGVWTTMWHLIRVFFGWHLRDPQVEVYQFTCVSLNGRNVPVHVDAEPVGVTPVEICIRPRSLRVLVPKTANPNIFSHA